MAEITSPGRMPARKDGRVLVGRNDVDLVALLLDDHADAVVVAALVFAHLGVGLGIVEVGVRVEHAQHAGDGAVVDGGVGLVAVDGLGVVLLHQGVDVGKGLEAVADLALVLRGLRPDLALHHAAHNGADGEEDEEGEKCPAGAGSHRRKEPPDSRCARRLGGPRKADPGLKYTTRLFDETGAARVAKRAPALVRPCRRSLASELRGISDLRRRSRGQSSRFAIRAFTMTSMLQGTIDCRLHCSDL